MDRSREGVFGCVMSPTAALRLPLGRLEPQMADQPDHCEGKRDHQDQKHNPAFAPFFPQRNAPTAVAAAIAVAFVLQRNRDIEAASPRGGALQQLLTLAAA